jgi:glycosyltransferase involved in cell wall biosynthesis
MVLAIFWEDYLHYHVARIAALCGLAKDAGHTVHAFALRSASPELPLAGYHELLKNKIQVLSYDPSVAGKNSSLSKSQLLKKLDETNPDAVAIVGYAPRTSRAALAWCRYHRRGAILMLESQAKDVRRASWKEGLKARLVSCYDAAFVSGIPQAAYAKQLGLPSERIFSGYGVVDNEFWMDGAAPVRAEATSWRKRLGLPEHFFLTACRFIAKKNLSGLVSAYAKYVEQAGSNPWSLVLVGDGELAPALRQQVASLKLTHLVHFLGYLSADEMAQVYGLASVFILASAYFEQWGLVVNEAMAAGLPVLVSNICGCLPDLVPEGVTGFTFDPREESQLTQHLLRLSDGSLDLEQMGRNAQAHIQNYSPEHFAHNLFAAAEMAIAHARSRRWPLWPPAQRWP